jgi:hypothetical protein
MTKSDHQNHNRATLNEGCMMASKDRSIISKLGIFKNIMGLFKKYDIEMD